MKNPHKTAYRLLLLAEVLTKIDAFAIAGYVLKIIGYAIIVIADTTKSSRRIVNIIVILLFSVLAMYSVKTAISADYPIFTIQYNVAL